MKRNLRRLVLAVVGIVLAAPTVGIGSTDQQKVPITARALNGCTTQGSIASGGGNAQLKIRRVCLMPYAGKLVTVSGFADGKEAPNCDRSQIIPCQINQLFTKGAQATVTVTLTYGPTIHPVILAKCTASGRAPSDGFNIFFSPEIRCFKSKALNGPPPAPWNNKLACVLEVTSPKAQSISGAAACTSVQANPLARSIDR